MHLKSYYMFVGTNIDGKTHFHARAACGQCYCTDTNAKKGWFTYSTPCAVCRAISMSWYISNRDSITCRWRYSVDPSHHCVTMVISGSAVQPMKRRMLAWRVFLGGWTYIGTQKKRIDFIYFLGICMRRMFALRTCPVCSRRGRAIAYCEVGNETRRWQCDCLLKSTRRSTRRCILPQRVWLHRTNAEVAHMVVGQGHIKRYTLGWL